MAIPNKLMAQWDGNLTVIIVFPKLQDAALIGGRHLLEGGTYFKVKGIVHLKIQNFVIFSFQII